MLLLFLYFLIFSTDLLLNWICPTKVRKFPQMGHSLKILACLPRGGEGYPNMLPEYFFAIRAQRFELSCSQTSIRNDVIPQHTYLYAVVIRTQRRTSIAIWKDGPKENLPRQSCHDSWHKALRRYREIGLSSSLILYWYAECYFVGP